MMQGPTRERWEELCAQAADEQDSQKLLELVSNKPPMQPEAHEELILLISHRMSD